MAKAGGAPKRKAAAGYKLAERLPLGEILEDVAKTKWKLGPSIGHGGLAKYILPKIFQKGATIDQFKKDHNLKTFGMPVYYGSGSHEYKGDKYRFLVMEKFGSDIWKLFLENNKTFPTSTVFKIAIQILDVLEYIHSKGYVHADIKGANILLGETKDAQSKQVYLVDFGLATKYTTEPIFRPNPKKAHDGTIEYLSRDAHQGVPTRRGDLEILAYNLIHWLGGTLPWDKKLTDPKVVQKNKEEFMQAIPKSVKTCFGNKAPPGPLLEYLSYLKSLSFDSVPDYKKIRKIFLSGLDPQDKLDKPFKFGIKKTPQKRKTRENSPAKKSKAKSPKVSKVQRTGRRVAQSVDYSDGEVDTDSESPDVIESDDEVETVKPKNSSKKMNGSVTENGESDAEEDIKTSIKSANKRVRKVASENGDAKIAKNVEKVKQNGKAGSKEMKVRITVFSTYAA
nr:unnamed protein product [Callosobruchus analis]